MSRRSRRLRTLRRADSAAHPYALGKFFIDPIWWFFLFWLPGYLGDRSGLDLKTFALPVAVIYLITDMGSIGGGWMSSKLIAMGRTVNFARKVSLPFCAILITPIWFAQDVSLVWGAVLADRPSAR